MEIIVQKYGGNLVKDKDSLLKVAKNIINCYNKGNKVVAVVSAQGDTTDSLKNKINEITKNPVKRETDVVLSSGEQITAGLLSIILNDLGYSSISFNGSQAGILTDDNYTNSNITSIDTERILTYLDNNIVIVTGFQGITSDNNITTLGRGGSDTTATYLAGFLNSDCAEIFKDTSFIYTADPKIIENAKSLHNLSYDQMFSLSSAGAKVLCDKCINFAKEKNVRIDIKSVETGITGTYISNELCAENFRLIGITKKAISDNLDRISIVVNDRVINIDEAVLQVKDILNMKRQY